MILGGWWSGWEGRVEWGREGDKGVHGHWEGAMEDRGRWGGAGRRGPVPEIRRGILVGDEEDSKGVVIGIGEDGEGRIGVVLGGVSSESFEEGVSGWKKELVGCFIERKGR